jgi:large subunit ribosomal protein L4
MIKYNSYDLLSKKVSEFTLKTNSFDETVSKELMQFVVKDYLHVKRSKSSLAKTRANVSGGGAKPWKQKGTGRARAGTNSSPLWRGGGVVFGPQNIKRKTKVNKKVKKKALINSLCHQKTNTFVLENVSNFNSDIKKLRDFASILKFLSLDESSKLLYVTNNKLERESIIGNLSNIKITTIYGLNVYDILNANSLLFDDEAMNQFKEIFLK